VKLPARSPVRPAGAFTIVEIVVAMGILLLGMSSILGLLSFGAALARSAQLKGAAAASVEAVVADLEEVLFPLVKDERDGAVVAGEPHALVDREVRGQPGLRYDARATLVPRRAAPAHAAGSAPAPGPAPELYQVDVAMRWSSAGRAQARHFTILLPRQVPFGERLRREFVLGQLDPLGAKAVPPSPSKQP
jgi:hypothetical protein